MSASIQLPGGLKVLNQQPEITKYFNNNGDPYTSTLEVLAQLTSGLRHIGLTVNINNVEYWFKDGILDSHLVEKIPNVPPQTQSDWNEGSTSSVSYIKNKPDLSIYQPLLIDGLNIKTINNESVLGSGSIIINGGVTSFNSRTGSVTFSISDFISVLNGTGFLKYNNNILSYDNNNFLNINGGTLSGNLGIFSNNPTRQLVLNTNPNTFTQSAQTLISYQRYNVEKALQGLAGFDDNGFKGVKAGDFIYKGTSNIHLGFAQSAGGGDEYGIAPAKVNPALSINNRNYIGINNSNPFYELDILGDVRINGGTYSTTRIDYLSLNDYYFFPSNTTSLTRTVNGNQLTINSTSTNNFVWFATTQVLSQRDYFLSFTVNTLSISSPLVNIYYKINDVIQDSGLSFSYNVGSYTYSFTTPNDVSEVRVYFNRAKSGSFTLTSFNLIEYQGDGQITIFPKNGLSPIITNSSLLNTNLNSDLLDGFHASDFSRTNHVHNNLFDNTLNSTGILVDNGFSNFYGDAYLNKIYGTEIINNGTFSNPTDLSSFGFFKCTGTISSSRLSISTTNLGSAWLLFNVSSTFSQYRVRFTNISSTQNPLISGILYVTAGNIWDTDFGGSGGFTYSTGSTLDFEFVAKYSGTVRVYLLRNSSTGRTVVFDDVSVRQVTKFGDITANKFIKIGSTSSQFLMGDGSTNTLKTINNQSLLGVGNIDIQSGVTSFNGRTGSVTLNITDVKNADTNIELAYKGTNSYVVDKNGNFLNATYSISSNKLVNNGTSYIYLDDSLTVNITNGVNFNSNNILNISSITSDVIYTTRVWGHLATSVNVGQSIPIGETYSSDIRIGVKNEGIAPYYSLYSTIFNNVDYNVEKDLIKFNRELNSTEFDIEINSKYWAINKFGTIYNLIDSSSFIFGYNGFNPNTSFLRIDDSCANVIEFQPVSVGKEWNVYTLPNFIGIQTYILTQIGGPFANSTQNGALTSTDWNIFNNKQNLLVSGTNIKTINGNSILGTGSLVVSGIPAGVTGSIQFNSGGIFTADSSFIYFPSVTGTGTSLTIVPTLTSSVNSQTHTAVNINPTFNVGGFVNITRYGLAVNNGTAYFALSNTYYNGTNNPVYFNNGMLFSSSGGPNIQMSIGIASFPNNNGGMYLQTFANNFASAGGNLLLQPNIGNIILGAPLINSYKLNIQGTPQSGTSSIGVLNIEQTWNTSGNPTALFMNISSTQSGVSSRLIDLQFNSVSQFNILRDGTVLLGTTTTNGVDKLQVNGSVMANSYKTSTGTSNDVLLADGTTVTKGVLANSSASAKNICMVQTII